MLPKICTVNVKKTSGSYVSNGKEVYTEALNNAGILKQQLDLYQPDLVICCGTEHAFVDAVREIGHSIPGFCKSLL